MSQNPIDLLTLEDVAQETGFTLPTIRYWINHGVFCTTAKIGRRRYVRRADLDRWIADKFTAAESA